MAKEEIIMKLGMLEQEAKKVQEQIELVNQQIQEFEVLKSSLEQLDESKGKEILASLGKGIFFKTKMLDEKVLVNIGNNIVLNKTCKETCEIIDKQEIKMGELKEALLNEIEKINIQLQNVFEQAQSQKE